MKAEQNSYWVKAEILGSLEVIPDYHVPINTVVLKGELGQADSVAVGKVEAALIKLREAIIAKEPLDETFDYQSVQAYSFLTAVINPELPFWKKLKSQTHPELLFIERIEITETDPKDAVLELALLHVLETHGNNGFVITTPMVFEQLLTDAGDAAAWLKVIGFKRIDMTDCFYLETAVSRRPFRKLRELVRMPLAKRVAEKIAQERKPKLQLVRG